MGQQDDRGPPGGMAAGCLPTLALDADTATMAGGEQEGRPRTARRCRCDHSHSAREVRPCWRGRRPGLRVCDAAHLQPSGRPTWHGTQIRQAVDAGFRYRAASGGTKKTTDPKLVDTHVDKLRLRLMYYVTEYGVHPSCIINMDETAAKLLGLGHRGWARPKQDGRVRFIGSEDKRNLTISTVVTLTGTIMAQLIVEGATKRVVQDLPEHENISYAFSESHWCTESTCQELIEWLGAWVRKQGFLHWVLLWDCASVHRKASLLEWIRTAHPECHGWRHSGAAASRHRDPAASQAQHQTAGHAILWVEKKHEHHNESLAPPLLDIRRGTKACGESHSRAPRWHTLR